MLSKRTYVKRSKWCSRKLSCRPGKLAENFSYQSLEPKQMLASFGGSDAFPIIEYDLLTGTETVIELPEKDSSGTEGGRPGFQPHESDPKAYTAPAGFVSQESVFGNDDRVFIADPHLDPYHESGALRMQWPDGGWSFCSGAMVGPFHFLTAGHCVQQNDEGGFITQGTVSLGRDGDDRWWGAANVTTITTSGWTAANDPANDWALLRLDRSVGDNVGWEGWWWWSTNGPLTGLGVSIAGYPQDLAGDISAAARAADEHVLWMYESTGNLLAPTTNQLRYNDTLDTEGGMSGSGVIEDRVGTGRLVVGVHAYGDGGNGTNEATRMRESISDIINDRRATWAEPDNRADLIDWDSWFNQKTGDVQVSFMNTTTVRPGDSFTVTTYPRNNGTATAGAFDVSFYASTNTTISSADHLLGTVSMSSLGEFAWDTATLNTTIADTLPAGNYYVGWIIDSGSDVVEFSEGNNTGYITANQLTVIQPLPLTMTAAQAEGQAYFVNNSTLLGGVAGVNDTLSFDAFLNSTNDTDSFVFSPDVSGTYQIRGGDFGNVVDPALAVYNGLTGERLALDDDSGIDDDSLINIALTAWTPYVVAIGDWFDAQTGDVEIEIAAPATWFSETIPLNSVGKGLAAGLLNVNEDVDFFHFVTPANVDSDGTLVVTPMSGSGLDAVVTLWDGDGNLIQTRNAAGANGPESFLLTGLTPGQTYRVGVQSESLLSAGTFDVVVDLDVIEPVGIDFGPMGSPILLPYVGVSNEAYNATAGYGWLATDGLIPLLENRGNDLIRDKVNLRSGTFAIDVDNGMYNVDVHLGVVKKTDAQRIIVEGTIRYVYASGGTQRSQELRCKRDG